TYDVYIVNGNEKVYLVQGRTAATLSFPDGSDVDGDGAKETPPTTGVGNIAIGGMLSSLILKMSWLIVNCRRHLRLNLKGG
ncbi:MAG: hypothetical protein K6U80_19885, partial [Firmicutes bacterium]|nr:hypothetical protein [Bacillota bacterium]